MAGKTKTIGVQVPAELAERLERQAAGEMLSVSAFVRRKLALAVDAAEMDLRLSRQREPKKVEAAG